MSEYYPGPSSTNMTDNLQGFQNIQPPQVKASGSKQTINGQSLLNAKAPGKLNENRFSSLKPSRNDK